MGGIVTSTPQGQDDTNLLNLLLGYGASSGHGTKFKWTPLSIQENTLNMKTVHF